MGLLGGKIGELLLSRFLIPPSDVDPRLATYSSSFEEVNRFFRLEKSDLAGLRVMDFGCGYGGVAIEVASLGADQVIGLDIRENVLAAARARAEQAGVTNCIFINAASRDAQELHGAMDAIISIDGFEHYRDPESALHAMSRYLKRKGRLYISFGPPWWHPYGAHLQFMTRLPWPHVLFTERILLNARARYKSDGAQVFEDVEGGLNRMTVRRFLALLEKFPFRIVQLELTPIRRTEVLHRFLPAGRETLTSTVKACLEKVG